MRAALFFLMAGAAIFLPVSSRSETVAQTLQGWPILQLPR